MTKADAINFFKGLTHDERKEFLDDIGAIYSPPHQTRRVQVWVEVDEGIADLVLYLNTIPGVWTDTSCQGGTAYRPYVMCHWTPEGLARLEREFDVVKEGNGTWGYVHPRDIGNE